MAASSEYRGEHRCSLAQTIECVGEKWMFFVLREALAGIVKFSDFKARLGIASDVLSDRLNRLVEYGVMEKREYREPGQRAREGYFLTDLGTQLKLVIVAMEQWGATFLPSDAGTIDYQTADGAPVSVRFVDKDGNFLDSEEVVATRPY